MSETSQKYEELCFKRSELKQRMWHASERNDFKVVKQLEQELTDLKVEMAKEKAKGEETLK